MSHYFFGLQSHRTAYDIAMAKGNVQLAELFTNEVKPEDAATEFKTKRTEYNRVIEGVHILSEKI